MSEREVARVDLEDAVVLSETNLTNAVRSLEKVEAGLVQANVNVDWLRNQVLQSAREYVKAKENLERGKIEPHN